MDTTKTPPTWNEMEKEIRFIVQNCLDIAQKRWNKTIPFPKIEMNGISGITAGKAYIRENLIKFNGLLMRNNWSSFKKSIIQHEVAHLLSYRIYGYGIAGHGPEFKIVCVAIGGTGATCHSYDTTNGNGIEFTCGCINKIHKIAAKKAVKSLMCKRCKKTIVRKDLNKTNMIKMGTPVALNQNVRPALTFIGKSTPISQIKRY